MFVSCGSWGYLLHICVKAMVSFLEDINTLKVCLCSYSSNISFKEKKVYFEHYCTIFIQSKFQVFALNGSLVTQKNITVPQLFDTFVIISEFTISSVSTKLVKEHSNIINVYLGFIHSIMQSSKTRYIIFSFIELFVLRRLPSYVSINK
jgi:hypothetical protein